MSSFLSSRRTKAKILLQGGRAGGRADSQRPVRRKGEREGGHARVDVLLVVVVVAVVDALLDVDLGLDELELLGDDGDPGERERAVGRSEVTTGAERGIQDGGEQLDLLLVVVPARAGGGRRRVSGRTRVQAGKGATDFLTSSPRATGEAKAIGSERASRAMGAENFMARGWVG